jgi:hypothetical protein
MIRVDDLKFSYTKEPFIENVQLYGGAREIFVFSGPVGEREKHPAEDSDGAHFHLCGQRHGRGTEVRPAGGDFMRASRGL